MDNSEDNDRRARARRTQYLTQSEMLAVIASPRFAVPMTVNYTQYTFYRGRRSATVITMRFNVLSDQFTSSFVTRQVMAHLDRYFSLSTLLTCCTDYDLVLVNNSEPVPSYYIWTANSNRTFFSETHESVMSFTHQNVHRYCREAMQVHLPGLEINFVNSNCSIDRLLSITLSFIV